MSIHSTRRHLLGALGASGLALGAAACGSSDPFEEDGGSGAAGSDGGGEAIQALLNGTAQASAGGFADIYPQVEAGRLRALGVVAAEPLAGVEEIPTLRSQGYDVTLTNWRALFVRPGVSAEERTELEALIAEAVDTPEWKEAVQRNYWNPVPLSGAELEEFIAAEKERIGTLTEEIK